MPEAETNKPAEANKPKPPAWRYSEAKKLLLKDIEDRKVTAESDAETVHNSRPQYKLYKLENFRSNLNRYLKDRKEGIERANSDDAALNHDEALGLRKNNKPYPRWQGSMAEELLKKDLDDGKYEEKHPSKLRATRPEFKAYPKKVFRDHIQQELRARRERPYWLARRAEKQAEKEKKTKKKTEKNRPPPKPVA